MRPALLAIALCVLSSDPALAQSSAAADLAKTPDVLDQIENLVFGRKQVSLLELNARNLSPERREAARRIMDEEWDRAALEFRDAYVAEFDARMTPEEMALVLDFFADRDLQAALAQFRAVEDSVSAEIVNIILGTNVVIDKRISAEVGN